MAGDVELVDVARQALFEASLGSEARIEQLAVLGAEDGEDDVDAEVGQPVVEHVRVVVLVLRERDLQRAHVGQPVERRPAGGELRAPSAPRAACCRGSPRRRRAGGSRAGRCSRRSSRRSRWPRRAGVQHAHLLAQGRPHRARRGVLVEDEHPPRGAAEGERPGAAGLPQPLRGHPAVRRRIASPRRAPSRRPPTGRGVSRPGRPAAASGSGPRRRRRWPR